VPITVTVLVGEPDVDLFLKTGWWRVGIVQPLMLDRVGPRGGDHKEELILLILRETGRQIHQPIRVAGNERLLAVLWRMVRILERWHLHQERDDAGANGGRELLPCDRGHCLVSGVAPGEHLGRGNQGEQQSRKQRSPKRS